MKEKMEAESEAQKKATKAELLHKRMMEQTKMVLQKQKKKKRRLLRRSRRMKRK